LTFTKANVIKALKLSGTALTQATGVNNGYTITRGQFKISLDDFMKVFTIIGVAQNNV